MTGDPQPDHAALAAQIHYIGEKIDDFRTETRDIHAKIWQRLENSSSMFATLIEKQAVADDHIRDHETRLRNAQDALIAHSAGKGEARTAMGLLREWLAVIVAGIALLVSWIKAAT